ncbi:lactonase family protein [Synoicihabitans lomoniglobus]|uniref:Lactonase family protein n=1 Tax=Synoicihabitans lomoniglobus TaxID=2909285 RepID=A0AAE9ZV40_9BACT|nr:lactonase family protein [Opitutaceae bacterium LMO-M01]WED63355.1 lactonase family protein [Opitutaceae bacterium LMO-M01]
MPRFRLLGLWLVLMLPLVHAEPFTVLLGTYTRDGSEGIYATTLDPTTGAMTKARLVKAMPDPEFLALHPQHRIVYALTRDADGRGGVVALTMDPASGALTELNRRTVTSGTFCHLAVDPAGRRLIAVSYGGGYTTQWTLTEDGRLGPGGDLIKHHGPLGPNPDRQEAPHAHSVTISRDARFAFVADLGLDRVLAYDLTRDAATLHAQPSHDAIIAAGAGPRHSTFSPDGNTLYVLNELDGSITVLAYDATDAALQPRQHLSILPADYHGRISSSEIRAHPNGRFIYAAHRGDNTIAIFARDEKTGTLTRTGAVPTGGQNPRNFVLSPDGRWLLCANQDSHNLTAFRVNDQTGDLTATGQEITVARSVCVLFVPHD